ncbi:MAG: hypothetical protein JWO48_2678 [Bryobacterales bacterium]|nr:hypothetical protein [Bryobacterales bacterium]
MKIAIAAMFIFLACARPGGASSEYPIAASAGNRLALEVYKTGLMRGKTHVFSFTRYHGDLRHDPASPESSHVHLVIESGSATLEDTWPSAKDRQKIQDYASHEMLDAQHYPELVFDSEKVTAKDTDQFMVHGQLTIRSVTKPVTVMVTRTGPLTFEGSTTLKLTDYGLKPPSAALGTVGTKDEMTFTFRLTVQPGAGSR